MSVYIFKLFFLAVPLELNSAYDRIMCAAMSKLSAIRTIEKYFDFLLVIVDVFYVNSITIIGIVNGSGRYLFLYFSYKRRSTCLNK